MRPEDLQKILEAERLKNNIKSKELMSKSTMKSITYKGISDKDLFDKVIPKIIDLELNGQYSKEKIIAFVEANIEILPAPVRHIIDSSAELRRMDSLSRLLSLDSKYTPCVAVAFYNGKLIVSSNTPSNASEEFVIDCLTNKMVIIQDFLKQLIADIPVGSMQDIEKIQFTHQAKILAIEAILKLQHDDIGGVGDVVPPTRRHPNRIITTTHLQNALLKLGQNCLLGIFTSGSKGFNSLELSALFNKFITIVLPNSEQLLGVQLHAEQAIVCYLNEFEEFQNGSEEQVRIGISKLCCQACHKVLNSDNKTTHRGTHGVNFPNVYDSGTGALYKGIPTKIGSDLNPDDSSSDCEFFDEPTEGIETPTLADLEIDGDGEEIQVVYNINRLFKACNSVTAEAKIQSEVPLTLDA